MDSACRSLRSAHAVLCCRLLRRMLADLHQLRIVSRQALETWWHSTSDAEAVRDVSSYLHELKQSDIAVASPVSVEVSQAPAASPAKEVIEVYPSEIALRCGDVVEDYLTNEDMELFLAFC